MQPMATSVTAPRLPPEARGKIGQAALVYGVGAKADENAEVANDHWAECPKDRLLPMPDPDRIDPSWSAEEVEQRREISQSVAAVGELSLANLWRVNLLKPKSQYCDQAALVRMAAKIVENAASRRGERRPTEPAELVASFGDVFAGDAHDLTAVPDAVKAEVVAELNRLLKEIARAGFASRRDVNQNNAPAEVRDLSVRYSCITGSTVRFLHQLAHLLKVSRLGQTAHRPMTLGRRRMLVNDALAQLSEALDRATPWTVEALGLITPAVRQAWAERVEREPLSAPIYRDLFAWAERDRPPAAELDDPDLERLIQQHPDLEYVETLRAERRARAIGAGAGATWPGGRQGARGSLALLAAPAPIPCDGLGPRG